MCSSAMSAECHLGFDSAASFVFTPEALKAQTELVRALKLPDATLKSALGQTPASEKPFPNIKLP